MNTSSTTSEGLTASLKRVQGQWWAEVTNDNGVPLAHIVGSVPYIRRGLNAVGLDIEKHGRRLRITVLDESEPTNVVDLPSYRAALEANGVGGVLAARLGKPLVRDAATLNARELAALLRRPRTQRKRRPNAN
jgi:hypothetical protein